MNSHHWRIAPLLVLACIPALYAQPSLSDTTLPVSTQWVLDAANPVQRNAINSVFLVYCPASKMKGTSFLLKSGLIVTNNHVIKGCTKDDLEAYSPSGKKITFGALVTDPIRDLALLRPTDNLQGGLELAAAGNPALETAVSTFGFPLSFNGPAPILSVGYVAGYREVKVDGTGAEDITGKSGHAVRHMIVNGAFNPGNSGGPVFIKGSDKVVAVVVWKHRILSNVISTAIEGFKHPRVFSLGTFSRTLPDGSSQGVSDQEVLAIALEDFYNDTQVMIGEAISASELQAFLAEHRAELK